MANIGTQSQVLETPFVFNVSDFIKKNKLNNEELIRIFFSMIDLSGETIDTIIPRNYMSDFMVNMLKTFENLNELPGKLIIGQFITLAQKCKEQHVKLLIGEKTNLYDNDICVDTCGYIQKKYIHINFSEELVKEKIKSPIYIIQQEGNNIPEIKAIPLGKLVAKDESVDLNNPTSDLIAKCAAYLLFHELFHVNSFMDENYYFVNEEKFKRDYKDFSYEEVGILLNGSFEYYDDFRNTTSAAVKGEKIVPGEYELLQTLYPDRKIMRLYAGKFLNFSDSKVLEAAIKVANLENAHSNQVDYPRQPLNNLSWEIENFLKDKKIQFSKMELNDDIIQTKFNMEYDKLDVLNKQLKSYIQMNRIETKVDTSVWEAQANLYIENINKILEKEKQKKDMLKGNYIPS